MTPESLPEDFHRYATGLIDEKGICPFPCMSIDREGGSVIAAIDPAMRPQDIYNYFWGLVTREEHRAVILGLDRTTRPGQGTEFADVLTCVHWWHDPAVNWARTMRVGVINYQHEPRIVRPWDWENEYWNRQMLAEAKTTCRPPFRIKTVDQPPT